MENFKKCSSCDREGFIGMWTNLEHVSGDASKCIECNVPANLRMCILCKHPRRCGVLHTSGHTWGIVCIPCQHGIYGQMNQWNIFEKIYRDDIVALTAAIQYAADLQTMYDAEDAKKWVSSPYYIKKHS